MSEKELLVDTTDKIIDLLTEQFKGGSSNTVDEMRITAILRVQG